jgi:Ca2+-binding EF-hand superfamily protein
VFKYFDEDHSGTIDGLKLQTAINQFGMKLSPNLMSAEFCTSAPLKKSLLELFSNFVTTTIASSLPGSQVGEQTITFDQFVRACVRACS